MIMCVHCVPGHSAVRNTGVGPRAEEPKLSGLFRGEQLDIWKLKELSTDHGSRTVPQGSFSQVDALSC